MGNCWNSKLESFVVGDESNIKETDLRSVTNLDYKRSLSDENLKIDLKGIDDKNLNNNYEKSLILNLQNDSTNNNDKNLSKTDLNSQPDYIRNNSKTNEKRSNLQLNSPRSLESFNSKNYNLDNPSIELKDSKHLSQGIYVTN